MGDSVCRQTRLLRDGRFSQRPTAQYAKRCFTMAHQEKQTTIYESADSGLVYRRPPSLDTPRTIFICEKINLKKLVDIVVFDVRHPALLSNLMPAPILRPANLAGKSVVDENVGPVDLGPEGPDRSRREEIPVVLGLEELSQSFPVPLDADLRIVVVVVVCGCCRCWSPRYSCQRTWYVTLLAVTMVLPTSLASVCQRWQSFSQPNP